MTVKKIIRTDNEENFDERRDNQHEIVELKWRMRLQTFLQFLIQLKKIDEKLKS